MKKVSFALLGVTIIMLIAATVLEKIYGSSFAYNHLYTAPYTIALWGSLAVTALIILCRCRTWKRIMTFLLHISFVLILGGALITHLFGIQGKIHLRQGEEPVREFISSDGDTLSLPFGVALKEFSLENYTGTYAPMDYVSTVTIDDERDVEGVISMNNIFKYRNYRFYQSGYDRDGKGSTLSISFDPWGICLTYCGYICLLISMIGFFFQKDSRFRRLLKSKSSALLLVIALVALGLPNDISASEKRPVTISKDAAESFGNLYVYYNDRICPMQTLARDFTIKLYGEDEYKGLTAEQVLAGWFFHYDSWKNEPMIKIKGDDVRAILGIEGKYASLTDFTDRYGYKLDRAPDASQMEDMKNVYAANEKFNLISMVCTGSMLKIYPYNGTWYSLADRLPDVMSYEEWAFVTGSMNYVAEKVAMKDFAPVRSILGKIREYQRKNCLEGLPKDSVFKAEKLYNTLDFNKPLAMLCMTLGILCFLLFVRRKERSGLLWKIIRVILLAICMAAFIYLSFLIGMRWYISGHVPLSNGFETMQFLAWCSLLMGMILNRRFHLALPFGFLLCGFALLVSMMGEANPKITQLMPVLQSPLLSIHVMVIMVSYALFAFIMFNGVTALALSLRGKRNNEEIEYLYRVSNIMLYPAVFMLTAGIFIGAVWANVSWGRYWGWDPKEVWALITMLVYSFGMHAGSIKWFRKPMNFHIFCIVAFLCVLITYFGVNFILGGMHSYA